MLSSFGHQKNILGSAKNLLSNSVLYQVIELKKLGQEGARFNLYKCDGCNKIFEHVLPDEVIYVFMCNHKYHYSCANYHNTLVCLICKQNEMDNSVTNPNIISRQSLLEKDFNKSEFVGNKNIKILGWGKVYTDKTITRIVSQEGEQKNNLEGRLRELDKVFMERDSLVIIFL